MELSKTNLDAGCFGEVFTGKYTGVTVAIKRLNITPTDRMTMEKEYSTLAAIPPHESVIHLFGVCTDAPDRAMWLVMELCFYGSVKKYLAQQKQVTVCCKLMCFDVV